MTTENSGAEGAVVTNTVEYASQNVPEGREATTHDSDSGFQPKYVEKPGEERPTKRTGLVKKLDEREATIAERDAQLAALAKEAENVRQENARLKAERETQKPQEVKKPDEDKPAVTGRPKPEDFKTWGEYTDALSDHLESEADKKAEARVKQALDARDQAKKDREQQNKVEQRAKTYDEREAVYEVENPGTVAKIQAVVEAGLVTKSVMEAVLDSEQDVKIAAYLAENPKMLVELGQMESPALARAIGRLEGKLESSAMEKPRATTKAPAPIVPVKGKASTGSTDPEDMSQAEYEKWRYGNR